MCTELCTSRNTLRMTLLSEFSDIRILTHCLFQFGYTSKMAACFRV